MISSLGRFFENHFYFLTALSWVFGALFYFMVYLKDGAFYTLDWKATQYFVSYWEYGFVKRGVIGTLLYPIFSLLENSFFLSRLVIIVMEIFVFLIFVSLVHERLKQVRDGDVRLLVRALLVLSPLGFAEWSFDIGRYDHIAMVLVFSSCLMVSSARFLQGGALLALAVLCHEASAFYGSSVLFVLVFSQLGDARLRALILPLLKSLLPAGLAFIAVVIWGNIEAPEQLSHLELTHARGQSVWQRGAFKPALHLSVTQYLVNALYFLLVSVVFYPIFRPLVHGWVLFLAIIPFLILYLVGIDYPRWCHLFFISCLTLRLFIPTWEEVSTPSLFVTARMRFASLFLLIPLGPIGITSTLPYLSTVLNKLL